MCMRGICMAIQSYKVSLCVVAEARLRVILGWGTCRFYSSSEIRPSKRKGKTEGAGLLFPKSGARGLQLWAFLNSLHPSLAPAAAKLFWISLFRCERWSRGTRCWVPEVRITVFIATCTPLPWEVREACKMDRRLVCTPGQSWGRLSHGYEVCRPGVPMVT